MHTYHLVSLSEVMTDIEVSDKRNNAKQEMDTNDVSQAMLSQHQLSRERRKSGYQSGIIIHIYMFIYLYIYSLYFVRYNQLIIIQQNLLYSESDHQKEVMLVVHHPSEVFSHMIHHQDCWMYRNIRYIIKYIKYMYYILYVFLSYIFMYIYTMTKER